jgi:3-hydroxybutyryl-CoA dehydrogenase
MEDNRELQQADPRGDLLAVIGAGTMGHSIALVAAWSGIPVRMYGVSEADIEKAYANIGEKLELLAANGLIGAGEQADIRDRIGATTALAEAVAGATVVIEAAPEHLPLKQDIFMRLDGLCGPDVVLASNTSGLAASEIARNMVHPERMVIAHFWNPAHLVPLVEIVRGPKTSDDTVEKTRRLLLRMNKKPIEVKKEIPGFVGNRLQFALLREALYLLEQGVASKEDIDAAVTYSIGRRLPVTGPFLSADMGGLDVYASICGYLFPELSNAGEPSPALMKLVAEGKYGQKSGEGFYKWEKAFSEQMNRAREQELIRFLKQDRS